MSFPDSNVFDLGQLEGFLRTCEDTDNDATGGSSGLCGGSGGSGAARGPLGAADCVSGLVCCVSPVRWFEFV